MFWRFLPRNERPQQKTHSDVYREQRGIRASEKSSGRDTSTLLNRERKKLAIILRAHNLLLSSERLLYR